MDRKVQPCRGKERGASCTVHQATVALYRPCERLISGAGGRHRSLDGRGRDAHCSGTLTSIEYLPTRLLVSLARRRTAFPMHAGSVVPGSPRLMR